MKTKRGAPRKPPEEVGINILSRLTPGIVAEVDQLAKKWGISRSALIRTAVSRLLAEEGKKTP